MHGHTDARVECTCIVALLSYLFFPPLHPTSAASILVVPLQFMWESALVFQSILFPNSSHSPIHPVSQPIRFPNPPCLLHAPVLSLALFRLALVFLFQIAHILTLSLMLHVSCSFPLRSPHRSTRHAKVDRKVNHCGNCKVNYCVDRKVNHCVDRKVNCNREATRQSAEG